LRAEHIGSLPRPSELKEAFTRRSAIGEAKYRKILEGCILERNSDAGERGA
jgi:methionine synthase II (cobalamin-independent)